MKQISIIFSIWIVTTFVLAGCATKLSEKASLVQVADSNMIKDCIFLGDVHGSSGWGGGAASQGMQNSRNEAQEKAYLLNASHIVWVNISGGYSPFAVGKAYKCTKE